MGWRDFSSTMMESMSGSVVADLPMGFTVFVAVAHEEGGVLVGEESMRTQVAKVKAGNFPGMLTRTRAPGRRNSRRICDRASGSGRVRRG